MFKNCEPDLWLGGMLGIGCLVWVVLLLSNRGCVCWYRVSVRIAFQLTTNDTALSFRWISFATDKNCPPELVLWSFYSDVYYQTAIHSLYVVFVRTKLFIIQGVCVQTYYSYWSPTIFYSNESSIRYFLGSSHRAALDVQDRFDSQIDHRKCQLCFSSEFWFIVPCSFLKRSLWSVHPFP